MDPHNYVSPNLSEPFELTPFTPDEYFQILSQIKLTKEEKNCVLIKLSKTNRDRLSLVISDMINRSKAVGAFPESLILARVIPVF